MTTSDLYLLNHADFIDADFEDEETDEQAEARSLCESDPEGADSHGPNEGPCFPVTLSGWAGRAHTGGCRGGCDTWFLFAGEVAA